LITITIIQKTVIDYDGRLRLLQCLLTRVALVRPLRTALSPSTFS